MLTAIVCATDLSHRSQHALERAAQLAELQDLPLHVVSAIDPELPDSIWQAQADQVQAEIAAALSRADSPAAARAIVATPMGAPAAEIARYAGALKGSLVVLGYPRASSSGHLTFGAFTAGRILRAAVAPVLIVKGAIATSATASASDLYRKAVVGIDLSDHSRRAALLAASLLPTADIVLLHGYRVQLTRHGLLRAAEARREITAGHSQRLEELAQSLAAEPGIRRTGPKFSTAAVEGDAPVVLRTEVGRSGAELLVLGTHGRNRVSRALFGSLAEDMLLDLPCDLLITVPN